MAAFGIARKDCLKLDKVDFALRRKPKAETDTDYTSEGAACKAWVESVQIPDPPEPIWMERKSQAANQQPQLGAFYKDETDTEQLFAKFSAPLALAQALTMGRVEVAVLIEGREEPIICRVMTDTERKMTAHPSNLVVLDVNAKAEETIEKPVQSEAPQATGTNG